MKLLNLGCGMTRPFDPWINVDSFYDMFPVGTVERAQIDALPNYLDADITKGLPFDDLSIDGVLLSHVLEHFDAQQGLKLLTECYRVMKPHAPILVSVPDASYFRSVYAEDRVENWPRLFEVTDPNNPGPTFFERALWFEQHLAILTTDAVWAYLRRAGFSLIYPVGEYQGADPVILDALAMQLNRTKFSVDMFGVK
jgi:SAM-dependent methyltransferase